MPLSAAALSAVLVGELDSRSPIGSTDDEAFNGAAERQEFCDAIASAVIDYLKANTLVTGVCPSGGGPLASGLIT